MKPKFDVTAVPLHASPAKFSVYTSFAAPSGVKPRSACNGKIRISVPIGKKTVHHRHVTLFRKGASPLFLQSGNLCVAAPPLSIPGALVGKRLRFTVSFKGNKVLKPFLKRPKLVVPVDPSTVPISLTPGSWTMTGNSPSGAVEKWTFDLAADGSVTSLTRLTPLHVTCADAPAGFDLEPSVPDSPVLPTKLDRVSVEERVTFPDVKYPSGAWYYSHYFFDFDGPSHGAGFFQLTGAMDGPTGPGGAQESHYDCVSDAYDVELQPGSFS